jgi:hypothetical protein
MKVNNSVEGEGLQATLAGSLRAYSNPAARHVRR